MLRSFISLPVCILLFLASCKAQNLDITSNYDTMELIVQDNYGGNEDEEFLVIKDQKSLTEFFGIFNRTRKPGIPVPEIDFTKEMVLIWSPGENNKNSYLKIKTSDSSSILLKKIALKSAINPSVITRPVYIYKFPNDGKSIQIE